MAVFANSWRLHTHCPAAASADIRRCPSSRPRWAASTSSVTTTSTRPGVVSCPQRCYVSPTRLWRGPCSLALFTTQLAWPLRLAGALQITARFMSLQLLALLCIIREEGIPTDQDQGNSDHVKLRCQPESTNVLPLANSTKHTSCLGLAFVYGQSFSIGLYDCMGVRSHWQQELRADCSSGLTTSL